MKSSLIQIAVKFFAITLLLAAVLVLLTATGFAQQDSLITADKDTTAVTETKLTEFTGGDSLNMAEILGKMIGYLILIVVLIFGLVFFLKKFVYNRKDVLGNASAIRVLSSTYVAPKKSLLLVEVLDKIMVLAVTDSNMNYVSEISRDEYESFGKKGDEEVSPQQTAQFGEMFNKILKRTK